MRFMLLLKADKTTEAGALPDEKILIRRVFEAEDFGAEFTPELRAAEERLREQMGGKP